MLKKKKILILLLLVSATGIFLYNKQIQKTNTISFNLGEWEQVFAAGCTTSSHNVTGWAYAYPIGSISLSCTNKAAPVDYGVNINNNRELSGYAWSPAIGPISFNKNEICASGSCTSAEFPSSTTNTKHVAKVEYIKPGVAKITGWARALSACDFDGTKCTTNNAGLNAGGWDGWIKFDGTTINSSTSEPYFVNESKYNTIIKTVGSEHQIIGSAWGGILDSTREPPVAVLGEIRFINAKTTYDPNNACALYSPVAKFVFTCKNGAVNSGVCYYDQGSSVTLTNQSTDTDDACSATKINIKESYWTSPTHTSILNNFLVVRNDSLPKAGQIAAQSKSITPASNWSADVTFSANLKVVDDQGNSNTSATKTVTLRRAIQTNFSCCLKGENGGGDCTNDSNFKACNDSGFKNLTVTEETNLYLRDNLSVPVHTIPASGQTVSSRTWSYDKGVVSEPTLNTSIKIIKGGKINLKVYDSSGYYDDEEKTVDAIFGKIVANPDFKEIPFD